MIYVAYHNGRMVTLGKWYTEAVLRALVLGYDTVDIRMVK